MTVLNNTNKIIQDGDGFLTAFDFPFKIFTETDIEVYKVTKATGALALQTLNVNYTVSINTVTEGGTVTFTDAPEATEQSLINRNLPIEQPTDIPSVGNIQEEQIENEYDRGCIIDQQLQEQINRCLKLPLTETTAPEFPAPSPGKLIGWDDAGVNLENKDALTESFVSFKNKSANYTMIAGDSIILVDASGGAVTITLPLAADVTGVMLRVKKIDSSSNTVTIDGNGAERLTGPRRRF